MNRTKFFVPVILLLLSVSKIGVSQEAATPEEVVQKVQQAANTLSQSSEAGLAQFNQKHGPWIWKDSYIFLAGGHEKLAAQKNKPYEAFAIHCLQKSSAATGSGIKCIVLPNGPEGSRLFRNCRRPGRAQADRTLHASRPRPRLRRYLFACAFESSCSIICFILSNSAAV